MERKLTHAEVKKTAREWQPYLLDCIEAIKKFGRFINYAAARGQVDDVEFKEAMQKVFASGAEGVLDDSLLDLDKLHDALVENVEYIDDRPILEQIFGSS